MLDVVSTTKRALNGGVTTRLHAIHPSTAPIARVTDLGQLSADHIRCVVSWPEKPPLVSDAVALFNSLGLQVARHATTSEGDVFDLLGWTGDASTPSLVDALTAIYLGRAEQDGFNRLVTRAGLRWRDVALVRALCRYLRQTDVAFGLEYVERILLRNTATLCAILRLFKARFDPEVDDATAEQRAEAELAKLIDSVDTIDDDRVLRTLAEVVRATMRTNYWCRDTNEESLSRITLKIEPRRLPFIAAPRPLVETWVYSPEVEGLHLRMARVARGGLRWSARPGDFRAEVLGLMKAQAVKNSVIVPAGAKGAFVVRTPLDSVTSDAADNIVRHAYATFIRGLLDITDNLVDGEERVPTHVRRHDGPDTYLVVAADKGTATFSDLANSVAAEYDFWLGDAFASGGSDGYDHKRMGITARGAWVSVEAHLSETGFDPNSDEFTVVGIGDMSGDVFGNGMLLSNHIRLVAAFDHRHIFLDPDPDPTSAFAERQRLYSLPHSTWASYDSGQISTGGGVYPRSAKSIPLHPRVRTRLGIESNRSSVKPDELISAILAAPVTLLWNGGVGTYVKASTETDALVGDKSNDAVRIVATDLRCRIIGEGGNLGLTQRARIEFAQRGGRVNADFVDNSAGVNTSDHEVNLKILIDAAITRGHLDRAERSRLLTSMQDDVAAAVLADNRDQSMAIGLAVRRGLNGLTRHERLIAMLERETGLDRTIEDLPDVAELARRKSKGEALTRPEVATLLALSKISVRADLLESDLPDDPGVQAMIGSYFPAPVRKSTLITGHPLVREIAGTVLANDLVNQAGPGFFCRLEERTGARLPEAAAAFFVAREAFGLRTLWRKVITNAENADPVAIFRGLELMEELLEQGATWILRRGRSGVNLHEEAARLAAPVDLVRGALDTALGDDEQALVAADADQLMHGGLPEDIARVIALCRPLNAALDIVHSATKVGADPANVTRAFLEIGRLLNLDWLHSASSTGSVGATTGRAAYWNDLAWSTLSADLCELQSELAVTAVTSPHGSVTAWAHHHAEALKRLSTRIDELRQEPVLDLAMVVVAAEQMSALLITAQ